MDPPPRPGTVAGRGVEVVVEGGLLANVVGFGVGAFSARLAVLEEAPRWSGQHCQRVSGLFYVLLPRTDGAVVISQDRSKVYHVTGMVTPIYDLLSGNARPAPAYEPQGGPPFLVQLTLVPFRGFVSYDSLIAQAGFAAQSLPEL